MSDQNAQLIAAMQSTNETNRTVVIALHELAQTNKKLADITAEQVSSAQWHQALSAELREQRKEHLDSIKSVHGRLDKLLYLGIASAISLGVTILVYALKGAHP